MSDGAIAEFLVAVRLQSVRVLGHKTLAMSLRYSHLAPDRVTELGDKLALRLGVAGDAK